MRWKWFRRIAACSLCVMLLCGTAFAAGVTYKTITVEYADIKVMIDGNEIAPKDVNGAAVEPFIYHGTTYLPARAVAESLGEKVVWNDAEKTVMIGNSVSSQPTLKKLLQTALLPVGKTMYVWGGGWNEADDGPGIETVSMGVSPGWEAFAKKQNASYDFQNTRYQIHDGLDCSGYLGWTLYNLLNDKNGNAGYVMKSSEMAKNLADRGWGSYNSPANVKTYAPGSIMSTNGHVYIAVGKCADGSVLLLHSSPPGVRICGTVTPSGDTNSEAITLAANYMKKYYPDWYAKYPNVTYGKSYLTDFGQMAWDVTGNVLLSDPDGFSSMTPAEILKALFEEK